MKTMLVIISLLLFGVTYALVSYSDKTHGATETAVLRDITEKHMAGPNTDGILRLYDFSGENKWNGGVFRFSNITDVSYNQMREIKISSANEWLSNELDREKEVKEFKSGVSKILNDAKQDTVGRQHSSVYFPIATELNRLSQSKAQRRILLVFSDLMENDPDLSLYTKGELDTIKSNSDSIQRVFESRQMIGSLIGIEVHFIYSPLNAEADRAWRIVSSFYKTLLEYKGAHVIIEANLSN